MTHASAMRLFRKWTDILGFHGWVIECRTWNVAYINPNDDQIATMQEHGSYASAEIRLALDQSDKVVERSIVHELLHVKLIPLNWEFDRICDLLGTEAKALAEASYEATQEMLVDSWANSLLEAYGYGN